MYWLAQSKGITLHTEGLDGLPSFAADERRLYNALYNLVNNAIPEVPVGGTIFLRGSVKPDADSLILTVTDSGRGMTPDIRDSLFTNRVISRKPGGTGLGTKIVKDVVEAHGGQISVESEVGVGTTFTIRLPLRPPMSTQVPPSVITRA
jgi:signal transduction histidine kinase